jgi:predicted XRE-type DNA-binding protein
MPAASKAKITPSSGNVFIDLGFDEADAQVLALRADLMAKLDQQIKARKMTQVTAARLLWVRQSRISDLTRGKVERFSLDTLVQCAARLGKPAKIELST